MNVLALAYTLPPYLLPQSIQIGRLIRYLPDEWRLHVATADDSATVKDPTLYPDLASRFRDAVRTRVRHRLPLRAFRKLTPLLYRTPDVYRYAHARMVRQALRRWPSVPFDVVLTFPYPMSTALAGLRVSRRLGIPWITFLSDPWVDNPYFRYRGLARRVNARLEAKVFDAAAAVIVPSVRMQEWYVRKYGGAAKRIHVLPHSYDPAAFPAGDERRRPDARGAIVLRSVGSLSPVRTARGLIQALALARNAGPLDDVRVELIGPGAAHRSHRDLVDREGLGDVVALRGPVPYAESLALMRGADALVVIEAPMAESPYLPSKVADYVGAGPPILGLTPPGSELTRFLTAAGGAIAPPDDPERIRGVLLDLVARVRSGRPPAIAAETRRELDVTRNVARLVDDCERIVLATR